MKQLTTVVLLLLLLFCKAFSQQNTYLVAGKVNDVSGQPIVGATVKEKGTQRGTVTDTAGNFKLLVSAKKVTLQFLYVGMETQEQKVNAEKQPNIMVALQPSQSELQEVVVTGYGNTKADSYYVEPSAPTLRIRGISSYNQALQGKAAGINISNSGKVYGYMAAPNFSNSETESGAYSQEGYEGITENRFRRATDEPLSTFSIDVDGASYSNVRRYLQNGSVPPAGAVRIEELINYFKYNYPQPTDGHPFSINTEMGYCPWNPMHKLMLIGLQGKVLPTDNLPASNLVFLIDVSGSMESPDKLPLVKASLKLLVDQLRPQDKVSLVVYAGAAGLVLPPTAGGDKMKIKSAIDQLNAGGSTAGGEGILLAYKTAADNFIKGGNNRVILCTDGDFNVGVSSDDELERLIEKKREGGVFLSVAGFGTGNYQDAKMQKLADKGNGNHSYIDGLSEARKVFVNEFGGTLFTIAKDVKLQIEFNPTQVQGYRLIGYENRMLNKEDFNNDKKDAGELGSGHTVTALYEIIPAGVKDTLLEKVDALKYQQTTTALNASREWMTVKFRYKNPDDTTSKLLVHVVNDQKNWPETLSENYCFAAAVAQFGLLLRQSEFKQKATWNNAMNLAKGAIGKDEEGYRSEFIKLLQNAAALAGEHLNANNTLSSK